MEKENQKINCSVESCDYQDTTEERCTLNEIHVGCNCDNDEAKEEEETICRSFKNSESEEANEKE